MKERRAQWRSVLRRAAATDHGDGHLQHRRASWPALRGNELFRSQKVVDNVTRVGYGSRIIQNWAMTAVRLEARRRTGQGALFAYALLRNGNADRAGWRPQQARRSV